MVALLGHGRSAQWDESSQYYYRILAVRSTVKLCGKGNAEAVPIANLRRIVGKSREIDAQ
ncbi:hypothetical protein Pla100_23660 [Neorhodopirellula pilleata]|uniref:Uncharacterized protein n=1 Tax=Neorhodopirellula pilleata TaxID=2714738 RepID=A0A5C6ACT5_9BACT|nr:hypothetical protein Pla100_23660 [Neorhodopirellula pilleata]